MLRKIIHHPLLRSNFQRFSWFYKIYYSAALKIIVFVLGKQKEVVSVYLTASLARGDCVYGLSDIDPIVIIEGGSENKVKIEKIYKGLTRWIPILIYEEMGIFTTQEIFTIYKENLFYLQYKLFIECKKTAKLLYGKDILKDVPELDPRHRKEAVLNQMAFIWANLIKNFLINNAGDIVARNYLYYKFSADSCNAFMLAKDNEKILTRQEALENSKVYLSGSYLAHIEEMQGLSNDGFALGSSDFLQETYNFCFRLMKKTMGLIVGGLYEYSDKYELSERIIFSLESLDIILSDINRQKIETAVDLINIEYREYVESALLSPVDLAHIDERVIGLFIVPKRDIPVEVIKKLNSIIGSNQYRQQLYLYILTPDEAVSLNRADFIQPYAVFFLPQTMPLTFLYLTTPATVVLGGPLNCNKNRKVLINYYLQNFSESIGKDRLAILKFINDPNIVRLGNVQFQLFFWQALRLKLVEDYFISDKISMSLSSAQVCRECQNSQLFNFPWLEAFHEEYKKDLNGEPSDSEAYFSGAIALLKNIYNLRPKELIT